MAKAPFEDLSFEFIEPFLEAECGDFRRVASMLERGEPLPSSTRKLMADALRGEANAPKRRTRQQQRMEHRICRRVIEKINEGIGKQAAIDAVADEEQISDETIKTYFKKFRNEFSN